MAMTFTGVEDIAAKVGQEVGVSHWHEVTQEAVNQFADATGDHQWIHVDVERAKQGPFGGTIAHGYYTLSLGTNLLADIVSLEGARMGINYGLNRVRFTNPVRVGKRVRLRAKLDSAEEFDPNGVQMVYELTFEVEGEDKPACFAQAIFRAYF
jgi:acyl dehydratase